MEISKELDDFCNIVFQNFDKSHDKNHHLKVFNNARIIVSDIDENQFTKQELQIMTYATMLHDSLDHKYIGTWRITVNRDEIIEFLEKTIGKDTSDICIFIMENISWSKEMKGLTQKLPYRDILRQIVQDADWLEALGSNGIERCKQYRSSIDSYETTSEHLKQHILDKLLLIPKKLNTQPAYFMSLRLIQPLLDYLDS